MHLEKSKKKIEYYCTKSNFNKIILNPDHKLGLLKFLYFI